MLDSGQIEKVISILNTAYKDFIGIDLINLAKKSKPFAIGVIRQLCDTDYCLLPPSFSKRSSRIVFRLPLNSNEDFLNIILDCIELLSGSPAAYIIAGSEDQITDYILKIDSEDVIRNLISIDPRDPWCLAGVLFVEFNKNKIVDNKISIIRSDLFGDITFRAVDKFNYLLL